MSCSITCLLIRVTHASILMFSHHSLNWPLYLHSSCHLCQRVAIYEVVYVQSGAPRPMVHGRQCHGQVAMSLTKEAVQSEFRCLLSRISCCYALVCTYTSTLQVRCMPAAVHCYQWDMISSMLPAWSSIECWLRYIQVCIFLDFYMEIHMKTW